MTSPRPVTPSSPDPLTAEERNVQIKALRDSLRRDRHATTTVKHALSLIPSAPDHRLRVALERAVDAMDTIRAGLDVKDPSAIVVGADSILRHAAREARAVLSEATPDPALDVERLARATARVVGHPDALNWHREWAAKVAAAYDEDAR